MDVKDKTAVITGAASGIGLATAKLLARKGAKIVLADFNADGLQAAEAELKVAGAEVIAGRCDVADFASVQALAAKTFEVFGTPHIVHLNAGVAGQCSFFGDDAAGWERIFGINCFGVIWGIKAFLPRMDESGEDCVILATSSGAGTEGVNFGAAAYAATKSAVLVLMESLYGTLKAKGSKVRSGVVFPPLTATRLAGDNPDVLKYVESHLRSTGVPTSLVQPEMVAEMVADGIERERFFINATRENAQTIYGGAIGSDFFDWNEPVIRARGEAQIGDGKPDSYLW